MQMKTLIAMLFVCVLFLLTACQPAAPAPLQTSEAPTNGETSEVLPTVTPTETSDPTPETVVTEGSEAAMLGIPVGSTLETDASGNPTGYSFTNSNNNRTTEVAKIDKDGNIVKEEFLNHKLVSCTASEAEIRANKLPLELVNPEGKDIGLANKIALVTDAEPFPDGVVTIGEQVIDPATGETITIGIEMRDSWLGDEPDIKVKKIRWDEKTQHFFDAHPEMIPHRIRGCFAVDTTTDGVVETYVGVVHEWKNPKGDIVAMTAIYKDNIFFTYSHKNLDSIVFVSSNSEESQFGPFKFQNKILGNQEGSKILDEWVGNLEETKIRTLSPEAEKWVFAGIGDQYNYK